jgi:hypothetical protein
VSCEPLDSERHRDRQQLRTCASQYFIQLSRLSASI